ncbi:MAG: hypothetical protein PHV74_08540 [Dehalococcoidia bacterium]|nr:hypothetical protein [Dehalococcoidia bacterium]
MPCDQPGSCLSRTHLAGGQIPLRIPRGHKFAKLELISIGEMTLRNRILMAPMDTGYDEPGGYVSERSIAYYAARARGGVGMITVEGACVDYPEGSLGGGLNIDDDKYLPSLSKLD